MLAGYLDSSIVSDTFTYLEIILAIQFLAGSNVDILKCRIKG